MATIYSLICFGGRLGKTVTFTDAGDVVNLTTHGLRNGTGVVFSTTGSLPTGLTAGTTYYSKEGADTGKFTLWTDSSLTSQVTFSGTGTGTHTVKGAYRNGLTTEQLARYGDAGAERIYDSLYSCTTARSSAATTFDSEVWEIGENYIENRGTAGFGINIPAPLVQILPINASGHNGTYDSGYTLLGSSTSISNPIITLLSRIEISGITLKCTALGGSGIQTQNPLSVIDSCVVIGGGTTGGNSYGIKGVGAYNRYTNNIVAGFKRGFEMYQGHIGQLYANNLATGNDVGFYPMTVNSYFGFYYNNIAIGNVTSNWGAQPTGVTGAGKNAGISTDSPWVTSGNTSVTLATTDFVNFAGNNFRPSSSSSPQVDVAYEYYQITTWDIAGGERPNYNNGGAEGFDIGCFEFDNGYGPHPSTDSRGIAFTGLVSGSTVKVFTTGTDTEKFSATSSGTSETWSESVSGSLTVDYTIQKAGYLPIRVTGITVTAGPDGVQTVPVAQVVARWYQASSGLTINTNCFANTSTKKWGLTTTSTLQNLASYLLEQWVALGDTGEAYANKAFPLEANGPNSFTWLDGWEADLSTYAASITNLSRDGMRYLNSSGVMTASWCALLSAGVPAGLQVRFQQVEGATPTNAAATGNIDQLIQIYGDATHGSFDRRGYMVAKVQEEGYDQAEVDVVAQYGALEDQLYVIALIPTANGIAAANPTVSSVTITDHGASPVTWNTKAFSITITDSGTTSGQTIVQWIRHALDTGGTFQGKNGFNWHDLIQVNGDKFKGVRGSIYGDTGAALKGVRVLRGTDAHPDFTIHTADDGSTVSTTPPAQASATILADSRVQLYNVTTATELDNVFVTGTTYANTLTSGVSVGDALRIRVCKLGYDEAEAFAVWTASGASFLVTQNSSDVYAAWGIDGSTVTEFTDDVTGHIYIDANDLDGQTTKTRLGAWYSWVLTTEIGIRHFYGAVSYLAVNAIRINVDVADILIENVNATTALRFTDLDVRLYRSDGTSIIAPTSYSIHNDYSGVPDVVETGVSGLTTSESNALMGLPGTVGILEKIARNKMITDPATGVLTVYDNDGATPLLTANIFKDAAGTTPYNGTGAERRERLV